MSDLDLAWHFLADDRRMYYPPRTLVEAGKTYTAVGRLRLCRNGMHASVRAFDALAYALGDVVCRVRMGGVRLEGKEKVCARARTVLWLADAAPVLHEFACQVAEQALARAVAAGYHPDPRSTAVIAAKRAWLRHELDAAALEAAQEEAVDAFTSAHWAEVGEAALVAAWSAGRHSGSDAAWSAAHAAGRAAKQASAWAETNALLERLLLALAPDATSGRAPAATPDTAAGATTYQQQGVTDA